MYVQYIRLNIRTYVRMAFYYMPDLSPEAQGHIAPERQVIENQIVAIALDVISPSGRMHRGWILCMGYRGQSLSLP